MVRILRLLAMSGALLLPLASCELLFIGAFPSSIGQATARTDLTASIDSGPASYFRLSCVTSGGAEYFVLFSSLGFDPSRAHVIVMDSHLNVLNTLTLAEVTALPTVGVPLNGSFTMTECFDQVVIGNLWFDVQPGGFVFNNKSIPIVLNGPSVRGRPIYDFNETNFRIIGGNILYDEYDLFWGSTGTLGNIPVGTPSPAPQAQLSLVNVFTDPNSSTAPDVFLFQDNGSSRVYFLQIPKQDIDFDLANAIAPDPDLFTHAALFYPAVVSKTNLERESISYSRAGIIAYDERTHALARFTLDAPDNVSSLALKWNNGTQAVAGIFGTCCVVWDPATRILTRYEQWWP